MLADEGFAYDASQHDSVAVRDRIATLAPSSDFGTLTEDTVALGVTLVIASTLIASLGAVWLGRRFSAPIKLTVPIEADELRFLAAHDRDPFNRWQAVQTLAMTLLKSNVALVRSKGASRLDLLMAIDGFPTVADLRAAGVQRL